MIVEAFLVGFLRQRYGYNWVDVAPTGDGREIEGVEAWQELDGVAAFGLTETWRTTISETCIPGPDISGFRLRG